MDAVKGSPKAQGKWKWTASVPRDLMWSADQVSSTRRLVKERGLVLDVVNWEEQRAGPSRAVNLSV